MITLDEQIEWVETLRRPNGYMNLAAMVDATLATLRSVKQAEPVAEVKDGVLVVSRLSQGYTGPLYAAPAAPQSVEPGDPMGNWLMKPCLEWLEQAEHGENKQRCQMIADILRDLWSRQKPLEGIDGSAAPGREG